MKNIMNLVKIKKNNLKNCYLH